MTPTLLAAWQRTVVAAPDALALIDAETGQTWTRAALDAEANQWHATHGSAVAGRTVAFGERNGVAWLRVFLGLCKAHAVAAPFDPGDPPAARQATARAAGASLLWQPETGLESVVDPDRPARRPRPYRDGRRLVKLTSGSTGRPRALRFTDAQMLADGHSVCTAMGITGRDLNLAIIPWGHSYALGNLIVPLLTSGTALLAGVAPLPHPMAEAIHRWRPTVFPAVPALLHALAESTATAAQLSSLRTVITAGAPITATVAQAFQAKFDRKVHSFYGSSETGGIAYDASGERAARDGSVGQTMPGVRLTFTRGGRFSVSGPAVVTLGRRHPGTHRMADLARLDPDQSLHLLGRAGRFVKIAGRRLNLAEVEHALRQLPGVQDAFVALHPQRADALAAAVATDQPAPILREALRERLAAWKIPKKLLILPTFPLTPRGKPDPQTLRTLLAGPSR